MNFYTLRYVLCLLPLFGLFAQQQGQSQNYVAYHRQLNIAEEFVTEKQFEKALAIYDTIVSEYEFVFERDLKVAAQLAFYLNKREKAFSLLRKAIRAGSELNTLGRNKILKGLKDFPEWQLLARSYKNARALYLSRITNTTRETVQTMYKKDQRKAIGALFRIGQSAKERYADKKFLPHSILQMNKLIVILKEQGYPGENLIGNDYWMSTIIGHHNSISKASVLKDTLYPYIKPKLLIAVAKGQMSPYEFALIDDWQKAVVSERTAAGYGFLSSPNSATLTAFNKLRQEIGLRTIETRNKLVELEQETGIDFFLPDWVDGKIEIVADH